MARILKVGLALALSLMLGQASRAQSSLPDVEFSLFGGVPVATRFDFPGFASTLDTQRGGLAGAAIALRPLRQPFRGWTTYLALAVGRMQQPYSGHRVTGVTTRRRSTGRAEQTFMIGMADLRRRVSRRTTLGIQLGAGLMDHDVTGTFDANAKTIVAMAGVYGAVRIAPRVTGGPYAMIIAPVGTGTVKRGGVTRAFRPEPTVMLGVRLSLGL